MTRTRSKEAVVSLRDRLLNDSFVLCVSIVLSEPAVTPLQMKLVGRILKDIRPFIKAPLREAAHLAKRGKGRGK